MTLAESCRLVIMDGSGCYPHHKLRIYSETKMSPVSRCVLILVETQFAVKISRRNFYNWLGKFFFN